jgi:hypothetical protein
MTNGQDVLEKARMMLHVCIISRSSKLYISTALILSYMASFFVLLVSTSQMFVYVKTWYLMPDH